MCSTWSERKRLKYGGYEHIFIVCLGCGIVNFDWHMIQNICVKSICEHTHSPSGHVSCGERGWTTRRWLREGTKKLI